MKTYTNIPALQAALNIEKSASKRIGFVPTMGALHQGHISLIDAAREACDVVVCSIFVNPTQFNESSDFDTYPRTIDADRMMLEAAGCDFLFVPSVAEMYPQPDTNHYRFGRLEEVMEGANRPGHFNGVGMVVKRLLEIVQPDVSFFGEKDYQQLLIIRDLVAQYDLKTAVVGCPIVREQNGLAMSSRNQRLTADQRDRAAIIHAVLQMARVELPQSGIAKTREMAWRLLEKAENMRPEYFTIVDAHTLEEVTELSTGVTLRAFTAVWYGDVRLIDNMQVYP